jgi:TldD protein
VDADITAKVELLMRADHTARAYDPRIKEVRASYSDELRNILIVGSDGTFAEDSQPLARMNVSCIAKTEEQFGTRNFGRRRTRGARFLLWGEDSRVFAKEAARQAILQLDAREAPAGDMEVVLGPGWPGVCCTRPSGMGWKLISTARNFGLRRLIGKRVASENAPWSTMARCRGAAGL